MYMYRDNPERDFEVIRTVSAAIIVLFDILSKLYTLAIDEKVNNNNGKKLQIFECLLPIFKLPYCTSM